jgi:hypothetical protein
VGRGPGRRGSATLGRSQPVTVGNGVVMTMPRRVRPGFGGQAWGPGPRRGLRGLRLAEMQRQSVRSRLAHQARLARMLEVLQAPSASEAPPERRRPSQGGRRESPFSGRIPPHAKPRRRGDDGRGGDAGGRRTAPGETPEAAEKADYRPGEGGGVPTGKAGETEDDDRLRAALFEVFEEIVDRSNPALPLAAELKAGLARRGLGPIRRPQARPVFEEWLAGRR